MTTSVLVVDDSLLVRRQVGAVLRGIGYAVRDAVDGLDALEKLDQPPPTHLIVCDINMPRMSGLELLERLSARGSSVPVVMLTTERQPELMRQAKSLGAKGWLVKPFKPDILAAAATTLAPVAG